LDAHGRIAALEAELRLKDEIIADKDAQRLSILSGHPVANDDTQSPRDYRDLLRRYAAVCAELATANARVGELTLEVRRLVEMVARGNERITELLAVAQRKKRGTRATPPAKPPTPAPAVDANARRGFEERPSPPTLPEKPPREPKPRRPTGRKPVPEHLEAEEHTLKPDSCAHCGGHALEIVDQVVETKLHVVKEHQRRRIVTRKTCRCQCCGERTTARSLPAPFERSKVTCDWLAWLVHQKFALLMPLDRIRRDLAVRGIHLAMSFLVTQIERAADLLARVDGEQWRQLLAGAWMATDATGLKVLLPKLKGTQQGYLEVYRRDAIVNFQYEPDKGSESLKHKLSAFCGTLVADAEHRHNVVFEDGRIVEAGCNAHGRRKLRDAEVEQPVLAAEGGAFISALYMAEGEAGTQGLVGDELRTWRQSKMRPIQAELLRWMDAVEPTLTPSDSLAATIRYYRNHWAALFRFIDHPELPIDNSGSEREFQQVAKLRLNSLFAGSSEGAHRAAILLGIVATCRNLGVDSRSYLAWAFTRLGTHVDRYNLAARDLTPAAFARERPRAS
jgi:transposase